MLQGSRIPDGRPQVVAPRSGPREAALRALLDEAHAAGLDVDFRSGVISLPQPVLRELLDGRRRSALRAS